MKAFVLGFSKSSAGRYGRHCSMRQQIRWRNELAAETVGKFGSEDQRNRFVLSITVIISIISGGKNFLDTCVVDKTSLVNIRQERR